MRKMMVATAVVALTMAFAGVSSASALQWNPQNTNVTATSGNLLFTTATGVSWSCTSTSWTAKATGSVMAGNGPAIGNCTNSWIGGSTSVTTSGRWSLTATGTTKATLGADTTPTSGGTVLSVSFGAMPMCSPLTVKGPISVPNQGWNNATHQLTISPEKPLTLHTPSGLCSEIFGSTVKLTGTLSFPASVTITP